MARVMETVIQDQDGDYYCSYMATFSASFCGPTTAAVCRRQPTGDIWRHSLLSENTAICEQAQISWDKLLLGMGATTWRTLQQFTDYENPRIHNAAPHLG